MLDNNQEADLDKIDGRVTAKNAKAYSTNPIKAIKSTSSESSKL